MWKRLKVSEPLYLTVSSQVCRDSNRSCIVLYVVFGRFYVNESITNLTKAEVAIHKYSSSRGERKRKGDEGLAESNDLSKQLMKSKMQSFGDSIVSLARALGITRQTCSKKIETVEGWTNIEIAKIAHRYNLNDDESLRFLIYADLVSIPKSMIKN